MIDEDFDAVCLENKRLTSENEALKFHIKWLEGGEEIDTKPVAWMHKESGQVFAGMGSPIKPDDFIPLYTHPAKTYEDAIEECAQRAEAYAYMSPNFTALAEELRAILRKAQEK